MSSSFFYIFQVAFDYLVDNPMACIGLLVVYLILLVCSIYYVLHKV